jgi:hypothetical protein
MFKKCLLITFSLMLVLGGYLLWSYNNQQEQWQTYNKIDHEKIESYPTTDKEVIKYKLPAVTGTSKKRSPAAIAPKAKRERSIINPSGKKLGKNTSAKNQISKEWKERLGQNLLRFLRPDTSVFIKKQGSVSLIEQNQLRHAEVVIIQLKSPEGRRYSYNAYVDSESGKVLQTWNRTIHEFYGQKPKKLAPAGTLHKDGSTRF